MSCPRPIASGSTPTWRRSWRKLRSRSTGSPPRSSASFAAPRNGAGSRSGSKSPSTLRLIELDEVAAAVREHGNHDRTSGLRLRQEDDTVGPEALVVGLDVVRLERREWDLLREHRLLERLARRI